MATIPNDKMIKLMSEYVETMARFGPDSLEEELFRSKHKDELDFEYHTAPLRSLAREDLISKGKKER